MVKRLQRVEPAAGKKPGKAALGAPSGTASVSKKADILIAIGASGSGKSTRVDADIKRRNLRRVIVWDAMHEYDNLPVAKSLGELQNIVRGQSEFHVRFLPSFDNKLKVRQFDVFCRIALAARKVAAVMEELSQVVNANGGGPGYTQALTAGRHRDLILYGTCQRPALIDKTSLSQATRLYCGNLELPADISVMSQMLTVTADELQALAPWDYIERHRETKQIHRGNLAQGAPQGGYL